MEDDILKRFRRNADDLETTPEDMGTAPPIETGEAVAVDEVRAAIAHGKEGPEGWLEMAPRHGGLVKPDIVFFGEQLPERFRRLVPADFDACDLLLVMGTSLQVQPFASLVDMPARDRRCGSQISVLQNETTRPRLYPAVLQLLSLESPRIHAMLGKRGAVP